MILCHYPAFFSTRLSRADKQLLWDQRYYCRDYEYSLPKILASAPSWVWGSMGEIHSLLHHWPPLSPVSALELLDSKYVSVPLPLCFMAHFLLSFSHFYHMTFLMSLRSDDFSLSYFQTLDNFWPLYWSHDLLYYCPVMERELSVWLMLWVCYIQVCWHRGEESGRELDREQQWWWAGWLSPSAGAGARTHIHVYACRFSSINSLS